MPKKRRNRGGGRDGASAAAVSDDETVNNNDGLSVVSNVSSDSYIKDQDASGGVGAEAGGPDDSQSSQDEIFEEKLTEAIDLATQKSSAGRVNALNNIGKAFSKKLVYEFVDNRRVTLTDLVERSLKKGKASEQAAAANLAVAVCLQMQGQSSGSDELYDALKPTLITLMDDSSCTPSVRVSAASALGTLCFLSSQSPAESETVMQSMEKHFCGKARQQLHQQAEGSGASALCAATLSSWVLLATVLPLFKSRNLFSKYSDCFSRLLDAVDVDLRIVTGEAIAVLYEHSAIVSSSASSGEDEDEDKGGDNAKTRRTNQNQGLEMLIPKLQQLSTDCHKYRSKKDRKEQKHSFRDILSTVTSDEGYYEKVSIRGKNEYLEIDSWAQKKQYEILCKALGSGVDLHLAENELVRDIFGLGPPIPAHMGKSSKAERTKLNREAFKCRTQVRGKCRDKRSAVI